MSFKKVKKYLKSNIDSYLSTKDYSISWFKPWHGKAYWQILTEENGEGIDAKITTKSFKQLYKEQKCKIKEF